jgi:hypothetical protein
MRKPCRAMLKASLVEGIASAMRCQGKLPPVAQRPPASACLP